MKSLITMKWDGVKPEQYDQIRQQVDWEGNIPKGAVLHVAGFNNNVFQVSDIWESEEDFNTFVQTRLMPTINDLGIKGEPKVEVFPVHAIFVPEPKKLN